MLFSIEDTELDLELCCCELLLWLLLLVRIGFGGGTLDGLIDDLVLLERIGLEL